MKEIFDASPECRIALDIPGFGAVAAAVRSATFGAQGNRRRGDATHREIRYGLPAAIRRAGFVGKRELQNLVSEFIDSYNQESVRRRRGGLAASGITAAELDGFSRAVEHAHSSQLAATLLSGVAGCHRRGARLQEQEAEIVRAAITA